ncbi:MAG: abortive infection protein [Nostocaceae cyanobacterium]|nr:abortive infection protein [Nostocaceae cyanobacterium]
MSKIKGGKRLFTIITAVAALAIASGVTIFIYHKREPSSPSKPTNYEIYSKNQYSSFNKSVLSSDYRAVGSWTGRLILPPKEQRQNDRVLFEVRNADVTHQNLVGKIVNLQWSKTQQSQEFVAAATRDVRFTKETEDSQKQGNLHPDRLNNLPKVGPLESLAGARPLDDVFVLLKDPVVSTQNDRTTLSINQQPVQISGDIYTLVTIVKAVGSDRFIVRHFNKISKQFGGTQDIIRIPQVIADREGISRSTNKEIQKSPLNNQGWYIYGIKDVSGTFVAQAIAPRAILQVKPEEVRLGLKSGLTYINRQNWQNTTAQKGTAKTVLLDPAATAKNDAVSRWREGDRTLVIHCFGGIGGKKPEPALLGVVTGHFAYGIATVFREDLSNELRFDIEYRQIYAHNPDGIVAGTQAWSSYMGDLQRGWLGVRPVSDAIVKFDAVTEDYDFDGIRLSPLAEFTKQLDIMTARYRVGDGTGAALVTPATSCVQDANQALFLTLKPTFRTSNGSIVGLHLRKTKIYSFDTYSNLKKRN